MRALWFDTPLGAMVAVGDAQTLGGLHFSGARHLPDLTRCEDGRDCLLLRRVQLQVGEYFEGRRTDFDLPLIARGTALQSAVWEALGSIAIGTTISYSELALRVGRPRAVRAVAQAVGDYMVLINAGFSRRRALLFNALSGLAAVLGGILGYFIVGPWEDLFPYLLVVASSSFIYVAVADLLPQLQQRLSLRDTAVQVGWLAAGLLIVVAVTGLLHGHAH